MPFLALHVVSGCGRFERDARLRVWPPVITSDDIPSHNPEINAVRDGENGIFYREGDPGALAEAILTLARDPELHSRMSAAALDSVHGEHGWSIKNMVNGFIECIDAVQTMKKPS